jgi:uncharacterized protein YgiM (DUF1202 family)
MENQSETLRVASASSIRKGPSTSSDIIGTAQTGAEVQVLTRESGWVQFVDPVSGKTGWIYSKFLVSAAVTSDTESEEGALANQLPVDEPPTVKPNQKSKGTAQSWAGQRSKAPPPETGTASTTPNPKALGRQAKGTAKASKEQVSQEALPVTETPRKRWRPEYSKLPADAEFVPPRQRRFGIFAKRRMLREGIRSGWEEEFPPSRY